ncbi:MAG: hypothetical protein HYT76_04445 [Deltaproteobacteria bacterium]|nr:hypothetical protein [Deltaproteobacteria bacterium]
MNWEISKRPLILAHRGFTKNHLENTLEAVDEAIRLHADGVEVDLRLTADEELVVYHDADLLRLAEMPQQIEKMPLSEIRGVRLKGRYKIPTLSELLDLVGDKILLNLEIKTVRLLSKTVELKLLDELQRFQLHESILISSFHPLPLIRLKKIAPTLKRGYLVCEKYFQTRYRPLISSFIKPFSLNPSTPMITEEFVKKAHQKGQKIFSWNVNDLHAMMEFVRWGVDGIFTDKPDLLLTHGSQRDSS